MGLGGPLAILIAVAATCRDLEGRLAGFWRSRPIGEMRLAARKILYRPGRAAIDLRPVDVNPVLFSGDPLRAKLSAGVSNMATQCN